VNIGNMMRQRRSKIVLDTALFVGFIVEFLTREESFDPDFVLHSWTGIVLIPIIAFHLSGNWGWVTRVWRNKGADREIRLGILNAVLGTLAMVCIITGFPLWFGWSDGEALVLLHTVTGMLSILLMFVHLVWNRKRIGALLRPRRATATVG
jgi:formate hydrogenlyase subunit 3/multisubunit Na+/H+ antiporter MnhD subunit